jgi:hypothetical protein
MSESQLTREEREKYGRIAMAGFWEDYTEGDAVATTRRWQQAAEAVITAYLSAHQEEATHDHD